MYIGINCWFHSLIKVKCILDAKVVGTRQVCFGAFRAGLTPEALAYYASENNIWFMIFASSFANVWDSLCTCRSKNLSNTRRIQIITRNIEISRNSSVEINVKLINIGQAESCTKADTQWWCNTYYCIYKYKGNWFFSILIISLLNVCDR